MDVRTEIENLDGLTFPGKTFADAVLEPVFNTQRDYYYRPFLEISEAHAVMLTEQGILKPDEASAILRGLMEVGAQDFSCAKYDPRFEDMFFTLEKDLERRIGPDLAGRLHIARSRNDVGICQFRMALREKILGCLQALCRLMRVLASVAALHTETVMPAYTHTQPAQPTTFAHYLLAFYDSLERSVRRLDAAYHQTNLSPLGAAAITTTGFPINRERTCALLGFDALVENSYDAIAGVDYITETASVLMTLGVDLSRFLKDTLDFCTREYGYYRLADPYVQISSIMPQKRNPSSLEHARPLASTLISEAQAALTILHNTPFGDMVDSEEQLQPRIYTAIECAERVMALLSSNYATMTVNVTRMRVCANEGFITATELADTLVREKGFSFRKAHGITAKVVRLLYQEGLSQSDLRAERLLDFLDEGEAVEQSLVEKALDPEHFIRIRGIVGGPAPQETRRMLAVRQERMCLLEAGIAGLKAGLDHARSEREEAVRGILYNVS